MFKKSPLINSIFFLFISITALITSCGSDDGDIETKDSIDPTIACVSDVNITVDAVSNGTEVTYNEPVGSDNLPGAVTTQTEGLASGEIFPVGTTTNTFQVKDAAGNTASCSFVVTVTRSTPSLDAPYFIGTDPKPSGKTWHKVENLSDEFDDDSFDESKWLNTDPRRWIGRAPGIFKENTVTETGGNLKLTAYKLDTPEVVNGNTFTHAGSYIGSKEAAQVGYYFECRMKANKTFMSSTFWLINHRGDGTGCDRRVTELDIQECVGQITTTAGWAQQFDETIHSNTHSRQADCASTPTGSAGGNAEIGEKAWAGYHVYAAWWKSATEVEFYLDGKKVYTVTPKANFDLPMYLRMVVETYDWNPVPADGGMTGTEEERTTSYDWVRTWELK
ncbi:HYR domain-containing protein [Flavivirga eckloniae]|uniref:Glycoside hydrolase n=1 Tax=Flavivirga eckloniae TaxID=1803846 RepID=A0A2K9PVK7_9FLAO|nr:HYR domain-containing protein [Flavivirga eckloniae]AUP81093.1 glycoside hydrolase [Flavivirga eckloniae]